MGAKKFIIISMMVLMACEEPGTGIDENSSSSSSFDEENAEDMNSKFSSNFDEEDVGGIREEAFPPLAINKYRSNTITDHEIPTLNSGDVAPRADSTANKYTITGSKPLLLLDADNASYVDWQMVNYNGDLRIRANTSTKMIVKANGNVGIGTHYPGHKLAVNGTIHAEEIIVDMNVPDYVFKEGYDRMSLGELEAYIKENHHLPGVPSEKDIDEFGVSIAEHQALLLQKIEELTLHVIEQNKELKAQQQKIARFENGSYNATQ